MGSADVLSARYEPRPNEGGVRHSRTRDPRCPSHRDRRFYAEVAVALRALPSVLSNQPSVSSDRWFVSAALGFVRGALGYARALRGFIRIAHAIARVKFPLARHDSPAAREDDSSPPPPIAPAPLRLDFDRLTCRDRRSRSR